LAQNRAKAAFVMSLDREFLHPPKADLLKLFYFAFTADIPNQGTIMLAVTVLSVV